MRRAVQPISLAGAQLDEVRHVCAFFTTDEEEYGVLLPFIQEGLSRGEKAIHIVNRDRRQEHLERLINQGIDASSLEEIGQLEIQSSKDAYLKDGRFDQDRMMATFESLASGNAGPFPFSRIVCQMDWAASDKTLVEEAIEFESRVNNLWRQHDDVVICTYRLSKFNGDDVIDVMRTHPFVIIGGQLQQNPFFTPPDKFLREFRDRRNGGTTRP